MIKTILFIALEIFVLALEIFIHMTMAKKMNNPTNIIFKTRHYFLMLINQSKITGYL